MEQKYWVPALERATGVLNLISKQQAKLKLMDIAKTLDINKSTLFSLLHTMCSLGWVNKNQDDTYSLGSLIGAMGATYLSQFDILKFFNLEAKATVAKINETVQLSILDERDIVYLGKQDASRPIILATFPGMRLPAYVTAMGKVHLSNYNYEQLLHLYPEYHLTPRTAYTVSDVDALWEQIKAFHREGYIFESQEAMVGFSCMAVPVYNHEKRIIAAISATLIETERGSKHDDVLVELLALSRRLSQHAGYSGS